MKKAFIYSMILATAVFSSCKGDYDDWAAPQTNAQEEAKNVAFSVTPSAAINLTDAPATVQMFTPSIESTDNLTPISYVVQVSKVNEEGNVEKQDTLHADLQGNVTTERLTSIISDFYGKYPSERTVKTIVKAILKNGTDEAYYKEASEVENKVTPANHGTAYKLIYNDGEELDLETSEADYPDFKISFTANANSSWQIVNADGDPVGEGEVTDGGKYNITYNAESAFASAEKAPTELYLTGSAYSWGGTWKQLTPIYGTDDQFWTIIYLEKGEEFKFAPQAGWGNDFGMQATVDDKAGANLTGDNNCVVGNSGWYLLHVTNGTDRIIQVLEPNVYLMGETAGEWNINESHKFTVPATKDEAFVSPAFAKDAELRMCVSIDGFDWWKTEFIVANGQIDYRGKGGDQARLNVSEGQKAYLNFTTGAAEIK